jgi:protein-L-isoaspartate(D-aspartate) O-methyltransferase
MDTPTLVNARNLMVDGQLRPSRVTDRRILDAMRRLPREAFLPETQRALAYADAQVPLGGGRVLLEPMVVARLVQASNAAPGAKVLVLGAGYAACVFAACGAQVTALEQHAGHLAQTQAAIAACGVDVTVITAPLQSGWPDGAPYDVIFIDGAVRHLPPLARQLRADPAGRLCAILAETSRLGVAVLAERTGDALAQRPLFDCAATLMPEFEPAASFHF